MSIARLRTDLKIFRSVQRNATAHYLVEDHISGEVLALREEEMFLCNQLAECDDLAEVRSRFEKQFQKPLDHEQLEAFVRYLAQRKLLADQPAPPPSIWEGFRFQRPETWERWCLFHPAKLLLWMANHFRWCYTRPFVIASLAIFILAFFTVVFNFKAVYKDLKEIVFPLSFFQMIPLLYLFVNIPGELIRGMTCTRFRGYCEEYGIWLAYNIMPRFYCLANVWDSPLKSQRNWTLFSPSYYAILVGSLGVLVWKMAAPNTFFHKWGLTISFICFLDSVIRLNFLWPSEGHYIISNHLEQDDFRRRSIRAFNAFIFRRPLSEPLSVSDRRVFITYGFLTLLVTFPCLALLGIVVGKMLISSYAGFGATVLIGIVSVKYRKGISGFLRGINMVQWIKNVNLDVRKRNRIALWGIILLIILLFPYPYEAGGSFKILPIQRTELRAVVAGEIKKVLVKENDIVAKGSPQAVIDQYEHQKNFLSAQAEHDKATEDLKVMLKGPKPEEIKKAEEQVRQAKTQAEYSRKEEVRLKDLYKEGVVGLEEYEKAAGQADVDARALDVSIANLALVKSGPRPEEIEAQRAVVRDKKSKLDYADQSLSNTMLLAPIAGKVVTPDVELTVGQYLKVGDLFAIYESAEEAQIEIQLPEADVPEIEMGSKVRFRLQAYPLKVFEGTVVLIAHDAQDSPNGRVVRVKLKVPNQKNELKPEMTGAAKVDGGWKPVVVAFTKPVVRFIMVEIWSWLP